MTVPPEALVGLIEGFLDGARHSPLSRREQAIALLDAARAQNHLYYEREMEAVCPGCCEPWGDTLCLATFGAPLYRLKGVTE